MTVILFGVGSSFDDLTKKLFTTKYWTYAKKILFPYHD